MNEKDWKNLWTEAWVAYQDYLVTANSTFQLLSGLEFPATLEKREQILRQRRIENEAREQLQIARNKLFDALLRVEAGE
jgi:hypothetical protein